MSQQYKTRDVALAAVLHMQQYNLARIDAPQNGKAEFIFDDDGGARQVADEFFARDCKVEPKAFSFALKEVKDMLWEKRGGRR